MNTTIHSTLRVGQRNLLFFAAKNG